MNNNIKFSPVDEQSVRDRMLAVENISALTKYGFLGWVAPHLYFGGFEDNEFLPSLCDWSWIEDWVADKEQGLEEFGDYRVIGSGPDGEPMVYKPN